MKKNLVFLVMGAVCLAPNGECLAASNNERVGLGTRKGEEQHPQATETKQYCTESGVKVSAGRNKERTQEESASQTCQPTTDVRSAEEARAELRKVERGPNN